MNDHYRCIGYDCVYDLDDEYELTRLIVKCDWCRYT